MAYNGRTTQDYWEKAIYCSSGSYLNDQTVPGSIQQLSRIHDAGWTVAYPLEQTMYLNGADESYLTRPTEVSFTMRWYHTQGRNEQYLGLVDYPSGLSGLAFNLDAEKNIYISVENSLVDAVGASGASQTKTVLGLGQALMTSYQLSAAVGGIVESEASFSALTMFVYSGASGNAVPAVSYSNGAQLTGQFILPAASSQYGSLPSGYLPTGSVNDVSAISANDMVLIFPGTTPFGVTLTGAASCFIQSFSCALSFNRHELKPLGYEYPPHRAILYPIGVDLVTDVLVSAYQQDQLQRISCLGTGQQVYLIVKQPCSNATLFGLYFDNLQFENQDFVTSIGRHDVVSIKWKGIISNPYQVFFNPTVGYIVNPIDNSPWGVKW